ncbi:MAG: haloalkane dehalogenase [Actinomycetota bacterium]|jgi:haloalkane dehalogenase
METLRTPDDRFVGLPGFDFAPHYVDVADGQGGELRVHYIDEGSGDVVLMMHGEPSWSFLYRHMIPVIVDGGCRAVAPDLVGFGKSDKPTERDDYSFQSHVDWMSSWLESVDLTEITLVCQDWGGLIGLRLVAKYPERFARVVVANTGLPTGDQAPTEAFLNWQNFSQTTPVFPIGMLINGGTTTDLSEDVIAGYDAPFPDDTYKAGARQFPVLVPTSPDDPAAAANRDAWKVLEAFDKPVLTAFSDSDPITKGGFRVFQERVPGAKGQPHTTIEGGGHFLQEDRGPELAKVVLDFIRST